MYDLNKTAEEMAEIQRQELVQVASTLTAAIINGYLTANNRPPLESILENLDLEEIVQHSSYLMDACDTLIHKDCDRLVKEENTLRKKNS